MALKKEFEEYANKLKNFYGIPSDEDALTLYGLYKQATIGDVNIPCPSSSPFNLQGKYKWNAWKAVEGKSTDDAMVDYITKVKEVIEATSA